MKHLYAKKVYHFCDSALTILQLTNNIVDHISAIQKHISTDSPQKWLTTQCSRSNNIKQLSVGIISANVYSSSSSPSLTTIWGRLLKSSISIKVFSYILTTTHLKSFYITFLQSFHGILFFIFYSTYISFNALL